MKNRTGSPVSPSMTDEQRFIDAFRTHLQIGDRQVHARDTGHQQAFVNYINLPEGVGDAGGGAEAENNRMHFEIYSGKGNYYQKTIPPGKVKIEMHVSALPRTYKLRAKTGTPEAIGKYLADFLNMIAREVPPKFTHTRP